MCVKQQKHTRSGAGILILTAIPLLLIACQGFSRHDYSENKKINHLPIKTIMDSCKLTARIAHQEKDNLTIVYTFENQTDKTVFLFNQIYSGFEPGGVFKTDKNRVYVEIINEKIIVSKKIIALPEGMLVERPEIPLANPLGPHSKFSETFTLALPLYPDTPYDLARDHEFDDTIQHFSLYFELGYFFIAASINTESFKVSSTQGPAFHFTPFPDGKQQIQRAGPLLREVAVKMDRLEPQHK